MAVDIYNDNFWCISKDNKGVWRCNIIECAENKNKYCSDEDFDVTGICPME